MNEQAGVSSPTHPVEMPKALSVKDLIALQGPSEKADYVPGALTPQAPSGSAASDIQPGDVLLLTGWLHRVSRAPDNTYRLHMSPNRNVGARDLIAMVPPPETAPGSPDVKVQIQTVRTFVKQQLLRQQEPSPRGSVMQRPIFVQLTGQLSYPAPSPGPPAQGKRSQDATARWEVRPVLDVRFAMPAESPDRSPAQ